MGYIVNMAKETLLGKNPPPAVAIPWVTVSDWSSHLLAMNIPDACICIKILDSDDVLVTVVRRLQAFEIDFCENDQ